MKMRENEAKKYIPGMTNHKIRRERERETGEIFIRQKSVK